MGNIKDLLEGIMEFKQLSKKYWLFVITSDAFPTL
jgi:hypothetical protein